MRVLFVGYDPETVDFTDPSLPPGLDAKKIQAGIDAASAIIAARGWELAHCPIKPDGTAAAAVERHLAEHNYDCVVVGAGVRIWARYLDQFEAVINAIHRGAPGAAIAFNTRPEDSADAVGRALRLSN